jgi:hypothetical protein
MAGGDVKDETPEVSQAPPLSITPTRAFSDSRLRRLHLAVLGALCSFNNYERGLCFPSHQSLADRSGYHVRNVRRALADLSEWGYLGWEENHNPKNGQQRTHSYMIHFEKGGASPLPTPPAQPLPRGGASGLRTEHVSEHVPEHVTKIHGRPHSRSTGLDPETEEPKPATRKGKTKPATSALHDPDADVAKRKALEAIDEVIEREGAPVHEPVR